MLNKHLNLLVAEVNLSHVKFKCHIDSLVLTKKIDEPKITITTDAKTEEIIFTPLFEELTTPNPFEALKAKMPLALRHENANIIDGVPYGKNSVKTKMSVNERLRHLVYHRYSGVVLTLDELLKEYEQELGVENTHPTKGIGRRVSFLFKKRYGDFQAEKMKVNVGDINTTLFIYDVDEFNLWIDSFLCRCVFTDGQYQPVTGSKNKSKRLQEAVDTYGNKIKSFPLKDVNKFSLIVEV